MTASEFEQRLPEIENLQLVDIRNPGEFVLGSIDAQPQSQSTNSQAESSELDQTAHTIVFCASGYRSSVGASMLREPEFKGVSTSPAATAPGQSPPAQPAARRCGHIRQRPHRFPPATKSVHTKH